MEKLKNLIVQLTDQAYGRLEHDLISHKSEKFLLLLQSMRYDSAIPPDLLARLQCNENAFYVLKSRLYDKIQKHLLAAIGGGSAQEHKNLSPVQILFEHPRETAIAMLQELEKKYLEKDNAGELIEVYSALKKAYYNNSHKYYYYSQLYNKQAAYSATLEKADDLTFTFNKTLSSYYVSRLADDLELILVLQQQMANLHALNPSPRIELLKHFMSIQTQLYTPLNCTNDAAPEDLLGRCEEIAGAFGNDSQVAYYRHIINFLRFEYYLNINQPKKAHMYFELVDQYGSHWLLLSPLCQAYRFLMSKLHFVTRYGTDSQLERALKTTYSDNHDFCTELGLRLYRSVVKFYEGNLKEASHLLNELINEASFKDCFYIESQVKLTLAFFYIRQTHYELADNLLKSLSRKLVDERKEQFSNVKACIKVLQLMMDKESASVRMKLRKAIEQFNLYNAGENRILGFIQLDTDGEMQGEAA